MGHGQAGGEHAVEAHAAGGHRERTGAERATEGLTVAVASALSFGLLAGPVAVFGTTARHLVTDTGTTAFSRFVAPVVLLAILALPLVLARAVFRSGLGKGRERLTAAVPATLTLLAGSVLPFAALWLVLAYAD
ncbi:hypothetical protein [Streptomyces sp. NPDC088757]|uniref:hypothetical protein n=1 Tax=Streptomyces sp. NPDC088757 TaxID=3365889 RepID=UPI00381B201E